MRFNTKENCVQAYGVDHITIEKPDRLKESFIVRIYSEGNMNNYVKKEFQSYRDAYRYIQSR